MKKQYKGFTLVELLVVIAIIAILAAVVVLIINPLELTRRGRDAARLTDLANLQQAITIAVQEASVAAVAYVACASDTDVTCTGNSVDGTRLTNGTGWVRINFAGQSSVTVPTLPIDPTNTTGATGFHYTYCGSTNSWRILARLESEQQIGKMSADGGPSNSHYEVGSNLTTTWAFCAY